MKTKNHILVCDMCSKRGARIRRITRTYGRGRNLLMIENVPVISCPNCGETYLDARTLHEIERIKTHRRGLAKPRRVNVATFAAAP